MFFTTGAEADIFCPDASSEAHDKDLHPQPRHLFTQEDLMESDTLKASLEAAGEVLLLARSSDELRDFLLARRAR